MRKQAQGHHAPINNDRGNAVAIVLLVLAVVSIVGVGLLTQSTMDLKFATSYKSHATAFNLADGAASLALVAASNTFEPHYVGRPVSRAPLGNDSYKNPTALAERGTYWPVVIYQGAITDPKLLTGEEIPDYYRQCWTAQGVGTRRDTRQATSNAEVRIGRHLPTQIDAQIPTTKVVKK